LRAFIELADQIGMDRIEKRHRGMADHILKEMQPGGAAPSKIRISTPYYLLFKDAARFLAAYEECRPKHLAA